MQAEITQHENCLEFQQFQNRNLVECRQEQKYGVLILSKKNEKKYIKNYLLRFTFIVNPGKSAIANFKQKDTQKRTKVNLKYKE